MTDSTLVICPYCFEQVELCVDADTEGTYVEDCEVCCNPWRISVSRDMEGQISAQVDRAQ